MKPSHIALIIAGLFSTLISGLFIGISIAKPRAPRYTMFERGDFVIQKLSNMEGVVIEVHENGKLKIQGGNHTAIMEYDNQDPIMWERE